VLPAHRDTLPVHPVASAARDTDLLAKNESLLHNENLLEHGEHQGVSLVPRFYGLRDELVDGNTLDVIFTASKDLFEAGLPRLYAFVNEKSSCLHFLLVYMQLLFERRNDHLLLRTCGAGAKICFPAGGPGARRVHTQFLRRHMQTVAAIRLRLQQGTRNHKLAAIFQPYDTILTFIEKA
jgi:hypothetical protein